MQFCHHGKIGIIHTDLMENCEAPELAAIFVGIYLIPYNFITHVT